MIVHKLTERFLPAWIGLGSTHLKHTEVPRETCLFCLPSRYRQGFSWKPCGWQSWLDNAHAEVPMLGEGIPDICTFFQWNLRRWSGINGHFSFCGQVNMNTILPKYMHRPWRLRWRAVGVKSALHLAAGIELSLHSWKWEKKKLKEIVCSSEEGYSSVVPQNRLSLPISHS